MEAHNALVIVTGTVTDFDYTRLGVDESILKTLSSFAQEDLKNR